MTKREKALKRLLSRPADYTFDELKRVLENYGYNVANKGKTSGSRIAFINTMTNKKIIIHKPHPSPTVKKYVIDLVIDTLTEDGHIGGEK